MLANLVKRSPRGAFRAIRYVAAGIALVASFYYVAQRFSEGLGAISASGFEMNYALLTASVTLTFLCIALGGWEWKMLVEGFGGRISLRKALKVHFLSNPPKYLPGFGWQLLGKAYLCKGAGLPTNTTALSISSELGIAILAAFSLVLLTLPYAGLPAQDGLLGLLLDFPWQPVAVAYILAVPLALRTVLGGRMAQRIAGTGLVFSYPRTLFYFVVVLCTWAISGLAFSLLVASLYPTSLFQTTSFVFATTLAMIVSLLAFFAPVGLGVREGAITFILSFWLPSPYPAMVAVLSRLVLIASELIGFAIATRL